MRVPHLGRLLPVAILSVTAGTLPAFLLGAGFVRMGEELGFGPTGLGVLTSIFFLTASAASAPLGKVVERLGWQRAIRVNTVGSAVVSFGIAAAAHHVTVLAAFLIVAAVFYGLANPAANQALADHVDPRRRAFWFGLKHAGIPFSTLLAGLAVPAVIVTLGWRYAYVGAGVLALLVALAVPSGSLPSTSHRFQEDPRRVVAPIPGRLLLALAAVAALAGWGATTLGTYTVAAAVDVGIPEASAGLLLFAGSAASIASRLVGGAATDHFRGRGFISVALFTGAGAAVFLALSSASGGVFGLLVIVAFATAWAWPGLLTFLVVNANTDSAAASSSITQAGVFVGAGIGPIISGRIIDAASFQTVWLVVAVAMGMAALGVTWVGRRVLATTA